MKRLSVAEQRIVEIARALAGNARILVMDEPTAALTEQEAKLIFRIIRRLKEQQVVGHLHLALSLGGLRDFRPHRGAARRPPCRHLRSDKRLA